MENQVVNVEICGRNVYAGFTNTNRPRPNRPMVVLGVCLNITFWTDPRIWLIVSLFSARYEGADRLLISFSLTIFNSSL